MRTHRDGVFSITRAAPEGYQTIARLHSVCFDNPWSAPAIERLLEPRGSFALVADQSGRPAGFLLCRRVLREAEILSIGVVPAARRQGIGEALLAHAIDRARNARDDVVILEVAADNQAARALYAAGGFEVTGWRPGYYSRPGGQTVSAVIMRCSLES